MINKQRVQRIKTLIYAFIILVLFLPLVLMSILSFRMIGLAQKMSVKLDEIKTSVSQSVSSSPEGDYVIEPEGQSSKQENPEGSGNPDSIVQVPAVSGNQPEANGMLSAKNPPDSEEPDFNDIGNHPGASGITSPQSSALNQDTAMGGVSSDGGMNSSSGNTAGASGGGMDSNPATGGESISRYGDPEKNPLTGC